MTLPANSNRTSFTISVTTDSDDETGEGITISMSPPTGFTTGANATTTVSFSDRSDPPDPPDPITFQASGNTIGALTAAWPSQSDPLDYHVAWARQDLDYLADDGANEAHRGNRYPDTSTTTLTLTGLDISESYKIRVRARFGDAADPASGWARRPWPSAASPRQPVSRREQ